MSKETRKKIRKLRSVAIMPSLMTLCNAICGFASIIMASRIHPAALYESNPGHNEAMFYLATAGWLIFGGMLFDILDGRFARMSNSASRFGAELDSLSDVITFGAAPAFLMLKMGPTPDRHFLYSILFIASTLYVVCTALRLARFNVETTPDADSHRFFKGLPSPAAAGCLASVAITRQEYWLSQHVIDADRFMDVVSVMLPFLAILVALLMVSNVRYPHLVNQSLRGRRSFQHLIEILSIVLVCLIFRELSIVAGFWFFALSGLVRQLRHGPIIAVAPTAVLPTPPPPPAEGQTR